MDSGSDCRKSGRRRQGIDRVSVGCRL